MRPRFVPVRYDSVLLRGGFDQVTPTLSLKPGVVRGALNFECAPTGGYRRIDGYERFDGRAKPSDATYQVLQVVSFTNTPSVGNTITGNTFGATGTCVAVGANYVVVTRITGSYTSGEVIRVGATTIGTTEDQTVVLTAKLYAQFQAAAANVYRNLIQAVPGSGPIRGVFGMTISGDDYVFAFRDNVGGTGCDLYVSSASGWAQVPYLYEVYFTTGNAAIPAEGATLTQGGVTATVRRIVEQSGSTTWGGTTAGKFIISAPAGGNFAAGAATLTGGATCSLTGAEAAITMLPGGRFETDFGNFTGASSTRRVYGADGQNRGWEFDGTYLVPIDTGLDDDTPEHVACFGDHLMFGKSSSIIHSGPGVPYRYLVADGGGEIAVGDDITNMLVQPGAQTTGTMAVYCTQSTGMLYGTSAADWNLVSFNTNTGGMPYTARNMAQSFVLDTTGVLSLATTLAYGNFQQATLTNNILPFIQAERSKAVAASLNRARSQYRLFFNDGYGLYVTVVNGKMLGAMPVYFPDIVTCTWDGTASGNEVSYFGDTEGYVYQMDVGTSFDGAALDAYFTLNWNAVDSPRILKRYRHGSIEMTGNGYAEVNFGYQLGYSSPNYGQPLPVLYASGFQQSSNWDLFTWDNFTWDGRTLFPTEVPLQGTAENMQITISSAEDYIASYTVNSIISHFSVRRGLR